MIEKFISAKNRSKSLYNNFFAFLNDFSDEEKCEIVTDVANELMKKGSKEDIFCAETILVYATQHYFNVYDTNYKALVYYALGRLNELYTESFIKAYTYYEKYVLNNTLHEGSHAILLRALLLRDNFQYSEQLENELQLTLGEYNLGYRNDRIYENLASFVIAKHENNEEKQDKLKKKLKAIVKADELFFLDYFLTKEKEPDKLQVPQKVKEYIIAL